MSDTEKIPFTTGWDWCTIGGLVAIAGGSHIACDYQAGAPFSAAWAVAGGVGALTMLSRHVQRLFDVLATSVIWLISFAILAGLAWLLYRWVSP